MSEKSLKTNFTANILIGVLILFVGCFIGLGFASLSYIGPSEATKTQFEPVSYNDFVTILLSGIALILTILTVFIALIAIVGYNVIRNAAVNEAHDTVESLFSADGEALNELLIKLEKNEAFRGEIVKSVARIAAQDIYGDRPASGEDDVEFSDS